MLRWGPIMPTTLPADLPTPSEARAFLMDARYEIRDRLLERFGRDWEVVAKDEADFGLAEEWCADQPELFAVDQVPERLAKAEELGAVPLDFQREPGTPCR